MSVLTLARKVGNLEGLARLRTTKGEQIVQQIRADPSTLMTLAGFTPDPWQADLLRSNATRILLLATRQGGKSQVAAALALYEALVRPGSLILLLSPSERQSGELQAKVFDYFDALEQPVPARKRTELQLHLMNRSRIIALPESERTIRGYSGARLLIIDEAARVDDGLYRTVRPMLAVSRGRLLALSTPFGKRGWFFDAWESDEVWQRIKVTAGMCPRTSPEYLAEERRALGERWYAQEFEGVFQESIDAVFSWRDIEAALSDDVQPLFGPGEVP